MNKKTLLPVLLACMIIALLSNTYTATNAESHPDEPSNTIMSTPLSESTTNSSKFVSYNSTSSDKPIPPEYTLELKSPPKFLPDFITNPNESQGEEVSRDGDNHWFKITYWGYPNEMTGTFTAVENTINPLYAVDSIRYLPLNVAYGTSTANYVWYQFEVGFYANEAVNMAIWEGRERNSNMEYRYHNIELPYTVGHTYHFSLSADPMYGYILFYIYDGNTGEPWGIDNTGHWDDTWDFPIAGFNMIYDDSAFSPASAIEGYTTAGALYDIPYLETVTGWGITTHWYSESGPVPSGIDTVVLPYSSYYKRWVMLDHDNRYYVEEIYSSGIYGQGAVSSETNLVGILPDWQCANIYGGNPGDGGYIVGKMDAPAGGTIKIHASSHQGYLSDLYVYVAADENFNWIQVAQIRITSPYLQFYSVATVHSGFMYIAVAGYDSGYSVKLHLDNVNVSV